jgi:hypothetical protein
VKEQSHKEEMSAALRGDFQRLRARGVSPSLVPHEAPEPVADEIVGVPQAVDEAPAVPAEPLPEAPPDPPDEEPAARRGWLSRLAGR